MRLSNVSTYTFMICIVMISIKNCGTFRCFQCRSDIHKDCYTITSKKYLKQCEGEQIGNRSISKGYSCRLIVQSFFPAEDEVIIRECSYFYRGTAPYGYISNDICIREVNMCQKEGCNACPRIHRPSWLFLLVMSVSLPLVLSRGVFTSYISSLAIT